jgi:hypothetical protein
LLFLGPSAALILPDALQATGNIITVMDALGHERVDTLRIYGHPSDTDP